MTDLDTLKIEPLGKHHDRAAFSQGLGFTPMHQAPMRLFLPLGPIHL